MAFCAIKAAEQTQDILAETRTVLDHHLKNLTATFIAISPRGRSLQGSMCPKQHLFIQDLIMHLTRIYHLSLQMCLKCRNIYFNDKMSNFYLFLLLQTHGT